MQPMDGKYGADCQLKGDGSTVSATKKSELLKRWISLNSQTLIDKGRVRRRWV